MGRIGLAKYPGRRLQGEVYPVMQRRGFLRPQSYESLELCRKCQTWPCWLWKTPRGLPCWSNAAQGKFRQPPDRRRFSETRESGDEAEREIARIANEGGVTLWDRLHGMISNERPLQPWASFLSIRPKYAEFCVPVGLYRGHDH